MKPRLIFMKFRLPFVSRRRYEHLEAKCALLDSMIAIQRRLNEVMREDLALVAQSEADFMEKLSWTAHQLLEMEKSAQRLD